MQGLRCRYRSVLLGFLLFVIPIHFGTVSLKAVVVSVIISDLYTLFDRCKHKTDNNTQQQKGQSLPKIVYNHFAITVDLLTAYPTHFPSPSESDFCHLHIPSAYRHVYSIINAVRRHYDSPDDDFDFDDFDDF